MNLRTIASRLGLLAALSAPHPAHALQSGARGYILKDTLHENLLAAIRDVAAGKTYNPPEIAARLDLREPNREAVRTINAAVSQYYDVEERQPPFEADGARRR